jgi:hypothetical protein
MNPERAIQHALLVTNLGSLAVLNA